MKFRERFLKYPICENKLPPALITQKAPNKTWIEGNTFSGKKDIKAVLCFDQGKFMLENFIVRYMSKMLVTEPKNGFSLFSQDIFLVKTLNQNLLPWTEKGKIIVFQFTHL